MAEREICLRGRILGHRITETPEAVELAERSDERLRTYSGGMMRRLAIVQALLAQPHVLILDEPTAGLDPAERGRFRELLVSLQGERLAILSTHIISDVAATATQVALLQQGPVIWTGTPAGLVADAEGMVWSLQVGSAEFDQLRGRYQISTAVRRGDSADARLIAATRPHMDAVPVSPTLEDAYLAMSGIGGLMAAPPV